MMTSNTLTASANTAGSLFQIFNLPKAGNSSYLFSDIIKIIGDETESLNTGNVLNLSTLPAEVNQEGKVIDASKLINLLVKYINGEPAKTSVVDGNTPAEQVFISENELKDFINLLGLEKTSVAAKKSSEIEIEITPEFLNKLSRLTRGSVKTDAKHLFISLDSSDFNIDQIKDTAAGKLNIGENGKIKIVFKKIDQDNLPAAPKSEEFAGLLNYQPNKSLEGTSTTNPALPDNTGETTDASKTVQKVDNKKVSEKIQGAGKPAEQKIQPQAANTEIKLPAGEELKVESNELSGEIKKAGSSDHPSSGNEVKIDNKQNIKTVTNVKVENSGKEAVNNDIKVENTGKEVNSDIKAKSILEPNAVLKTENDVLNTTSPVKTTSKLQAAEVAGEKVKINMHDSHVKLSIKPLPDKKEAVIQEPATKMIKEQVSGVKEQVSEIKEQVSIGKEKVAGIKEQEILLQKPGQSSSLHKKGSAENANKLTIEGTTGKATVKENEKIFNRSFPVNEILIEETEPAKAVAKTATAGLKSLYQVTIEKTEPKYNINSGKDLPQNFYTSDYEEFANGLFTDKLQMPVKDKNVENKVEEPLNNNSQVSGKDAAKEHKPAVKENSDDSQDKPAFNNNSADQQNTGNKQNMKQGTEFSIDHTQLKNTSFGESLTNKTDMPAKEHTLFKSINANDLIDEVKSLVVKGDKTNIVLKLNPEHLGSVKLTIDIRDAMVNTKIEVENESVKQVVQNNIETLKQSLQQSGIQLNSVSISLSSQEQKSSAKPEQKKKGPLVKNDVKIDGEVKTSATKKMGYNTYEYLA